MSASIQEMIDGPISDGSNTYMFIENCNLGSTFTYSISENGTKNLQSQQQGDSNSERKLFADSWTDDDFLIFFVAHWIFFSLPSFSWFYVLCMYTIFSNSLYN